MSARTAWALAVLAACGAPHGPAGPRCGPGVVVLAAQDDVAALAGCTRAAGLVIRTGAKLDTAPLAALAAIDGDLVIGPTIAVDEVRLDGLTSIGGALRVAGNGALSGLYLPQLQRAGRIEIAGNFALATVAMPRLAQVGGDLALADDTALGLYDATALAAVGGTLTIAGDPKLSLVMLPHLAAAGAVRIERAPALPPEVATALHAAARAR